MFSFLKRALTSASILAYSALMATAGGSSGLKFDGYPYEFILTKSNTSNLTEAPGPGNVKNDSHFLDLSFLDFYYISDVNLSSLKNPVLRIWDGPYTAPSGSVDYSIISYGKRHAMLYDRTNEDIKALPAIDGLRLGKTVMPTGNMIYTIGELPANKDDIQITGFTMNLVKGSIVDDMIMAEKSADGSYLEAEARFTAPQLSSLNQAYVRVNFCNSVIPSDDLTGDDGYGRLTCSATTPDGEIQALFIGASLDMTDNQSAHFLLPAAPSEIILRWRLPESQEALIHDGYHSKEFIHMAVQPGYHTVPSLPFNPGYLTGDYGDFKASDIITYSDYSDKRSAGHPVYDLNGDGVKDLLAFNSNHDLILIGFNKDFSAAVTLKKPFRPVLAFTPNGENTLGYDETSIFSVAKNLERTEIYSAADARFALVDFNNDGTVDFLNLNDNSVINILSDGNYAVSPLNTMSMDDYLGMTPPQDNPLGSGLSVIGDSKCPPAVFSSYIRADINGDGYPDFVDAASGNYYMNLGDGRFVTDSFGGKLLFRDFDGDGINDFLLYDSDAKTVSVTLQRIGEASVTKRIFNGYNCGEDIWLRDFDNDGDIDILIPFNAKDNSGMSFLVMLENNGSGTFKKKEYMIDGSVNFSKCLDWNADGKYEVLTDMSADSKNYSIPVSKIASYAIDGLKVNTTPEYILTDDTGGSATKLKNVVDFDNSGQVRFIIDGRRMLSPNTALNTRPSRPSAPSINFDESKSELTVTWQRGSDKETPSADLTYELRIGSTPDGDDLLRVAATPDGRRLDALPGNCAYDLKRKFNTMAWPAGDIYISVQAIDDSGLGSQFSQPAVFKNNRLPAQFIIDAPRGVAVYEDILLKASFPTAGLDLKWSADGGKIDSVSDSEAKVLFSTPGLKTVTLTVSDSNGNSASSSIDIEVYPIRLEETDGWGRYADLALDLDCDGLAEVYHDVQFYEGDLSGNYKKINRLFNTKPYYDPQAVDINRDGLADIIHSKGHLVNDGDKAMSDMIPDNFTKLKLIPDINNDGLRDIIGKNDHIMKNSGDYVNFIEIDGNVIDPYAYGTPQFFDFNNDGLIDIYYLIPVNTDKGAVYYENLGSFRFRKHELPRDKDTRSFYYNLVGDYDGNGKADFICSYGDDKSYFVLWDNGERTELGETAVSVLSEGFHNLDFDLDNNGCMDIIHSYNGVAVLFNADHSFTKIDVTTLDYGQIPYLRTDGKVGLSHYIVNGAPNEKPSVPTGLKAEVDGGCLIVTWNAASDKETPATAMRYNLSVKHVGADGEGAYVVSPMNGEINGALLPNDSRLIGATRFPIPLLALPKGEYEIRVQAVDGRMMPGDFSSPVTVKVESAGYDAPAETMVGTTVNITFNADVNIDDVDFGIDAVLERTVSRTAYVHWTSEGTKNVSAPGLQFTVKVHPALDASFYLPEIVQGGATVYIPADAAFEHSWSMQGYRQSFGVWASLGTPAVVRIDDQTVAVKFDYSTAYSLIKLSHVVTAPYGSDSYEGATTVARTYMPQIGIVDIDDATGKYCVRSVALGNDETEFMVYRETETANEYELVGTMSGNDTFIDTESSPRQRSSRYAVKARFYYGESLLGTPHQPIHAMISKGISGEWNISWNKYEGRNAATYRILRGDSETSLVCIAEVSGNTTSYSDTNPTASTKFYAVETLIDRSSASQAPGMVSRADNSAYWRSRSNTVSTDIAGIDDIMDDDDKPVDIYTTSGICLKRDATRQDIENLAPGIYIIGGQKVAVTK